MPPARPCRIHRPGPDPRADHRTWHAADSGTVACRYPERVLRTKALRSSSLRLLNDRDRAEVLALCDRDPVVNVFVSSRVHEAGLDPVRLGGEVWGFVAGGRVAS